MNIAGWNESTSTSATIVFVVIVGLLFRLKWLRARKAEFKKRNIHAQIFTALSVGLVILCLEPASSIFEGLLAATLGGLIVAAFVMFGGLFFNFLFEAECPDLSSQSDLDRYQLGAVATISGACWLYLVGKLLGLSH